MMMIIIRSRIFT